MSRVTTLICDRCGTEADERATDAPEVDTPLSWVVVRFLNRMHDLCPECARAAQLDGTKGEIKK